MIVAVKNRSGFISWFNEESRKHAGRVLPCFVLTDRKTDTVEYSVFFEESEEARQALYDWISRHLDNSDFDTLFYTPETLEKCMLYSTYYSRWMDDIEYAHEVKSNQIPHIEFKRL